MEPVVFKNGYTKQALSTFPGVTMDRVGTTQGFVEQAQSPAMTHDDDILSGGETFLLLTALSTLAATILMALP